MGYAIAPVRNGEKFVFFFNTLTTRRSELQQLHKVYTWNSNCISACPTVHLSICPPAQLCTICGKHSLVYKNEDIANKIANKFEYDLNRSKNKHAIPRRQQHCGHLCFPCPLLVTHNVLHRHHIKFTPFVRKMEKIGLAISALLTLHLGIQPCPCVLH